MQVLPVDVADEQRLLVDGKGKNIDGGSQAPADIIPLIPAHLLVGVVQLLHDQLLQVGKQLGDAPAVEDQVVCDKDAGEAAVLPEEPGDVAGAQQQRVVGNDPAGVGRLSAGGGMDLQKDVIQVEAPARVHNNIGVGLFPHLLVESKEKIVVLVEGTLADPSDIKYVVQKRTLLPNRNRAQWPPKHYTTQQSAKAIGGIAENSVNFMAKRNNTAPGLQHIA